jgi:hypothetical protein
MLRQGWMALISERRGGLQRQADLWHAGELGIRTMVGLRERQRR